MLVEFTYQGEIVGKGRARSTLGGRVHYTPPKTASAEKSLAWAARAAMGPRSPSKAAIRLEITIFRAYPKSWTQRRIDRSHFASGRPDCDNQAKLIGDALNKVVWDDDSQIVSLHVERVFTPLAAHAKIRVIELGRGDPDA